MSGMVAITRIHAAAVLRAGRLGRLAHVQRQEDLALEQMQAAAELELSTPKHPVTPAPTLPAEELLGDLHMEDGRPEEALAAYRRSLELHPNRLNSLIGAARAAMALGNQEEAEAFYAALMQVGVRASDRPGLQETVGDMEASTR